MPSGSAQPSRHARSTTATEPGTACGNDCTNTRDMCAPQQLEALLEYRVAAPHVDNARCVEVCRHNPGRRRAYEARILSLVRAEMAPVHASGDPVGRQCSASTHPLRFAEALA